MRRFIFSAVAVLLVAPGGMHAQTAPAGAPASQPVADKTERLTDCIRQVRSAERPNAAMSAYARGCAIDRNSADLHIAYMRRMLQFGQPQVAQYPARTLNSLQPDNSMAWGVTAYVQAKRGELADALVSALKALDKSTDDPSTLRNGGQLLAWYDAQSDRPKLPESARRLLERLRPEVMKQDAFARAFKDVQTAYQARSELAKPFELMIAQAAAAAKILLEQAEHMDRQLKDLSDQIETRRDNVAALTRELGRLEDVRQTDPAYYAIRRADLLDRITRERQTWEDLDAQARALRRKGEGVLADLKQKRATMDAARRDMQQAVAKVAIDPLWDPPAVDGVVTPEGEGKVAASQPTAAPDDPESKAAARLELARLYLRHDLKQKAQELLRELIDSFPSTKAAADAKALLSADKP